MLLPISVFSVYTPGQGAFVLWLIETTRQLSTVSAFLTAETGSTWLHTLLDGFLGASISAVIGVLVSLTVVWFTVRAQNRGIARQLHDQSNSVNLQLAEQRRENARNREHEATSSILRVLQGLPAKLIEHKTTRLSGDLPPAVGPLGTHFTDINTGIERLRLELPQDEDAAVDAIQLWASNLQTHAILFVGDAKWQGLHRPGELGNAAAHTRLWYNSFTTAQQYLQQQLVAYVRGSIQERGKLAEQMQGALKEFETMRIPDWQFRHMKTPDVMVMDEQDILEWADRTRAARDDKAGGRGT